MHMLDLSTSPYPAYARKCAERFLEQFFTTFLNTEQPHFDIRSIWHNNMISF